MSDMGDMYREMKEDYKERRATRRERNIEKVIASGLPFIWRDGKDVARMETLLGPVDFWPSSGTWIFPKKKSRGSGFGNLVREIEAIH